jgi:glycogen operon protein
MSDGKSFTITAGNYHQLGANYDGEGVNFALFSAHAQRVELCLYARRQTGDCKARSAGVHP